MMIAKKTKFADRLIGRWVLGVGIPLSLAAVWWLLASLTNIVEGSENGTAAKKQNDSVHPIVLQMKREQAVFLDSIKACNARENYKDSVRTALQNQYLDKAIDRIEAKQR